jgi:hypothetical protein
MQINAVRKYRMINKTPIPQHKRLVQFILFALIIASLQGCFLNPVIGPGYEVDLSVKDPNFRREYTAPLEEIGIREGFVKSHTAEHNERYAIYYHHGADKKYELIGIIISYDPKNELLRVLVLNDWEGQKMKDEIDRVADSYILTLSQLYGKENLRVVRRRTGPPM